MKILNFKGYNFNTQRPAKKEEGEVEIAFLTSNDSHGRISKLPRLKTARNEYKSAFKNTDTADFVVSSGDNIMGLDKEKHNIWIDFLNKHLKPDAIVAGNHEFDRGANYLGETLKRFKFPTLICNMDTEANKVLEGAKKDKKLLSSTVIEKKGTKIGLIGITTPEVHKFKSDNEMEGTRVQDFEKTKESLQNEVNKLQDKGINKIVVLSHMGYIADTLIAGGLEGSKTPDKDLEKLKKINMLDGIENLNGVRGVDIIIGGHTHDKITGTKKLQLNTNQMMSTKFLDKNKKKVNLIKPKDGEPVLIAQAGENNSYAGFIDLIFDKDGIIETETIINKAISIDNFKQNKPLKKEMEDKLGKQKKLFTLTKPFIDPKRVSENAIQNMIADGMLEKANEQLPKNNKADIAIVHGAMARGSLKGKVSNWDLKYDIVPFKEPIYMIKLSEKDLVKSLNNGAQRTFYSEQRPVLLHTSSNLKYEINKKPNNEEDLMFINRVILNGEELDLENLNEEKNINTLLEEYLMMGNPKTGGKEGFKHLCTPDSSDYLSGKIKNKPDDIIHSFGWSDKEALVEYAVNHYKNQTVELEPEDRIKILDNSNEKPSFGSLTHKAS